MSESSSYPQANTSISKEEALVRTCFNHLNAYKRFRAMAEQENNKDSALYYELQLYKTIDQLELALRGLQREIKHSK